MKIEDKIRIFGHYLFCQAKASNTSITIQSIDANTGCVIAHDNNIQLPIEECKLILKKLSNITKIEAYRCAELSNLPSGLYKNWEVQVNAFGKTVFSFPGDNENYRNMIIFSEDCLNWRQIDYLRSQGYAIGLPKEIWEEEPCQQK